VGPQPVEIFQSTQASQKQQSMLSPIYSSVEITEAPNSNTHLAVLNNNRFTSWFNQRLYTHQSSQRT
jgi:hypothetical protein